MSMQPEYQQGLSPSRESIYGPPRQAGRAMAPPPASSTESGFGANALGRGRLGVGSLIFFTVSASAPMTVLAGGVTTTFAVTGVIGVPLAFPIIAVVLGLFAVGYAAMSRHVVNAGVFYAYISQGLGGAWGTAASFVALVSYNAIQIGLYGLFGAVAAQFINPKAGVSWSWVAYAFIAMAVVAVLGLLKVDLNAKLLAVLLVAEVIAVVLFDAAGFVHPAGGSVSIAGLNPHNLFISGIGGVFAFTIAAYIGFESAGDYAEEAKDPRRTVGRSLAATVVITGVLYTVSAWALSVGVGATQVVGATQQQGPGVIFGLITQHYGTTVGDIANVLLMTSVFAALLSFHNTVARYVFAAGRERVLPRFMAHTSATTKSPFVGSLSQTICAVVVIVVFSLKHQDPVASLFTWFSYLAALGVLLLMLGTAVANGVFLNRRGSGENVWQRTIAPTLAAICLAGVTYVTAANANALLGTEKGSNLQYILPGIVVGAALVGVLWGLTLRSSKPDVYDAIGRGGPSEQLLGGDTY